MGCWHGDYRCDVVLLLCKLDEMKVLAFFNVIVVDYNDLGALADLSTELSVMLLLDLDK